MEHYHEHDHEDDNVDGSSPPGVGATTSSGTARWNPTKDQITMLENLYRQGIRTPSAEQIQQITAKLKAYGHIEGKNVFYWFQNHKARQRQKQKQESLAYLNRFLHKPSPTVPHFSPPPPLPNVMCSPYYVPQGDMGYFQPYPKLLLPPTSGFRRKPARSSEKLDVSRVYSSEVSGYDSMRRGSDVNVFPQNQSRSMADEGFTMMGNGDETLPLFPLHPTGVLSSSSFGSTSENRYGAAEAANSTIASRYDQPFFDFFSGRSSS